jgi:hypothetical protein
MGHFTFRDYLSELFFPYVQMEHFREFSSEKALLASS